MHYLTMNEDEKVKTAALHKANLENCKAVGWPQILAAAQCLQ